MSIDLCAWLTLVNDYVKSGGPWVHLTDAAVTAALC